jgi:hypothetical protein
MGIHDTKTRKLINLHIDRRWAANNGRLRLADVRNDVRVAHPYRDWHLTDVHAACNDYLGAAIREEMQQPMSQHFKEMHDIYVPKKYREILSRQPRGFFSRVTCEWVDALLATPDDWAHGEDARVDLARSVLSASEVFKENHDALRDAGASCWMELLQKKEEAA